MKKAFILLLLGHTFVDFFIGIWPVYKIMAGFDIAMAGLVMGIAVFVGDILQVGFGILSDRGHQRKLLTLGLLASGSALLLTSFASIWGALVIMLLVMIGSSSFHPAALGIISQVGPSKRNPVLLFSAFGTLGLGLSQIVFMKLTRSFGGHAYPLFIPLVILFFTLVFLRLPKTAENKDAFSFKTFFAPFFEHKRSLLLLYFTQVFCYGLLLAVIFMLPDILRYKGAGEWLTWGGGHMCLILGSMVGMLTFSSVSEKIGFKTTLLGSTSGAFVLLNLFLFSPLPADMIAIPLLSMLGIVLYLSTPVVIAWGNRLVPQSPSTVSAILMGLAWAFSSLFPAISGIMARVIPFSPYITTIALLSLFLLPSFACVLLMPKAKRVVYN